MRPMDSMRLRFSTLHHFDATHGRGEVAALFFQSAKLRVIKGGQAARAERERTDHDDRQQQNDSRSRS